MADTIILPENQSSSRSSIIIPSEQTRPLSNGLWGVILLVVDTDNVVKVPKDARGGLYEIEKKVYERLGTHQRIASYLGEATVRVGPEWKPGLLCRYYPLRTLDVFFDNPASVEICKSRRQQLLWAAQILDGLSYIHSCNVIHGDVGIRNILVDQNLELKFSDFGGSSVDGAEMRVECAPQYHRAHSWRFPIAGIDDLGETWKMPTRMMDTFALGTVLYEIFTAAKLYKDEPYDIRRRRATKKEYPDLGVIPIVEVRYVISNCWSEQYSEVEEVVRDLQPIWAKGAYFGLTAANPACSTK
ncbi:kinase-like protein [Tothia fuscella]|uniref:Kinase-like protein n=1 Tax=Tothia fuscella TaxID=1048955 RepID=A0A9P4NZV0_9PEZI|nr:kinase-like protein [Tothia fuscella]